MKYWLIIFALVAFLTGGHVAYASELTGGLSTGGVIPVAPSVTIQKGEDQNTLTWSEVVGVDGYRVYRIKDGGASELIADEFTDLTYTDTNLENGTYSYKVQSFKSDLTQDLDDISATNPVEIAVVNPSPPAPTPSPSSGGGGGSSPPPTPTSTPVPTPNPTPTPPPAPADDDEEEGGEILGVATNNAHPNGTLILDTDGTIYLIVNNARRGFRTPEEYMSHGYKFEQAVPANDADRALPDEAQPIEKALDGTLALDTSDNTTIYMIANSKKRGFTSAAVFQGLGYDFNQAIPIDLSDYPDGPVINDAEEVHPDGALILDKDDNRTVWWILDGERRGFQSLEVFNTYGFGLTKIVPANNADMALPIGPLIKFRDGTLVNDNGTIYVISDGKKRGFRSMDALTSRGYRISNAIQAQLDSYQDDAVLD